MNKKGKHNNIDFGKYKGDYKEEEIYDDDKEEEEEEEEE